MDRALPSRRVSNRVGSSSSISLPARKPLGAKPECVGASLFWTVLLLLLTATLVLYCWPAGERIADYREALDDAEAKLEQTRAVHAGLQLELDALDDPFTIEWILRREHNWQPTER